MKILILGGGPAGLYSGALIKKSHPGWDITVIERNPHDATYGWGVVFSDRTLGSFREADYTSFREITNRFVIWDTIDVRYAGESIRCGGNIFAGISRKILLMLLQDRCRDFGVKLEFLTEVRDLSNYKDYDFIIAADGINSIVRKTYADHFKPKLVYGKTKFIWLGTRKIFDAFTFSFRRNEHGLFQAHVYPNDGAASTFIVQCDPE
ncbi:MAG: FAD-dependent monooxygenase, partial [Candidatus Binataceae bacterium]